METLASPLATLLPADADRHEAEAFAEIYRLCPDIIRTAYGVESREWPGGIAFAAPGVDLLFFNRAIVLDADAVNAEALHDLRAWYAALGTRRFFVQAPPASPDVYGALSDAGLSPYNRWVKMRRGDTRAPEFSSALHVEEVGPVTAVAFAEILTQCFDWPADFVRWFSRLADSPCWQCYVARDGDMVLASGAMYVNGATAALGPAATLPEGRGRGAQTVLVQRRLEDAMAQGIRRFVTETGEDTNERPSPSYRNMRRFGFTVTYLRDNFLAQL